MKNLKLTHFCILGILILLSSCKAIFYTPNRNPTPLFKKQGDLYLDASTTFSKSDFTAGYALTDGLGVYAGYGIANETFEHDSANKNTYKYRGNLYNLGIGYFINEDKSKNTRFEIFGDVAFGDFNNQVSGDVNQYLRGTFLRIGVMPNIGYTSDNNLFHMAYSARLSQITFSNANVSDRDYWKSDLSRYEKRNSYGLLEHCMMFRYGFEKVKFQIQLGLNHGFNTTDTYHAIDDLRASISLGIVFHTNVLGGN